jgi:DNA-binding GntR family transcriptional regulator
VKVDQCNRTPLHEQLAAILRAQIQEGKYAESGRLPSESYLQQKQEHGVSRGTVLRVVETLTAEGLVYTITARGTFIGTRPEVAFSSLITGPLCSIGQTA